VETPKAFGVPAIFHPSSTAPATPRQGLGLTATPPTTIQNQQKNNPRTASPARRFGAMSGPSTTRVPANLQELPLTTATATATAPCNGPLDQDLQRVRAMAHDAAEVAPLLPVVWAKTVGP
jgi:hypothetical protein